MIRTIKFHSLVRNTIKRLEISINNKREGNQQYKHQQKILPFILIVVFLLTWGLWETEQEQESNQTEAESRLMGLLHSVPGTLLRWLLCLQQRQQYICVQYYGALCWFKDVYYVCTI